MSIDCEAAVRPLEDRNLQAEPAAGGMCARTLQLGLVEYSHTYNRMALFTKERQADTPDEYWIVEHPPVFTLGLAGKAVHILDAGDVPVVQSDRGGQVTYHGPGQLVFYLLLDLRRLRYGVRELVKRIEDSLIELLQLHGVAAQRQPSAPGVYVNEAKIAALGLRVKRGCTYHGLALNVDMDLVPFRRINPCGYPGLPVTQTKDLGVRATMPELANQLATLLNQRIYFHG